MTRAEAKQVLLRYRAGIPVIEDPELVEALNLARDDQQLGDWLKSHLAVQKAIAADLKAIPIPKGLRAQLNSKTRVKKGFLRKWPMVMGIAACFIALLALAFFFQPVNRTKPLSAFQARMVSFALREYSMDIVTNNVLAIRSFLETHKAPADFSLPPTLSNTEAKGGAKLAWQNNPVSMVCFKLGEQDTLYLFVLEASSFGQGPVIQQPLIQQISRLTTATWQQGDKIYFLAGNTSPEAIQRFLGSNTRPTLLHNCYANKNTYKAQKDLFMASLRL